MDKSNILAHRGFWHNEDEKNTKDALFNALADGYGIETDIRDADQNIVISHDAPIGNDKFYLEELLEFYYKEKCTGKIALNVKSDGLIKFFLKIFENKLINIKNIFFFDMSIPDQYLYMKAGLPYYERLSEYEKLPSMIEDSSGFWVDNFGNNLEQIDQCLNYINEKSVCIVSPELHKRDKDEIWKKIRLNYIHKSKNFLICTDMPSEAYNYFR